MGRTAGIINAIAWTAFQEALRRKVFYLAIALAVVFAFSMSETIATIEMASEAGETAIVTKAANDAVQFIFGVWTFTAMFLAIYLGAISLATEVTGKTIANILARPVDRAVYLIGRWWGTLAFVWAFQLLGVLAFGVALWYFGLSSTPLTWLGVAESFAKLAFYSGVGIAAGVVMVPVAAGVIAFLLPLVPSLVSDSLAHPDPLVSFAARAAYYLAPATMPGDLVRASLRESLVSPRYGLYLGVIGENLLYAIALFTIGCVIFSRREIRLR